MGIVILLLGFVITGGLLLAITMRLEALGEAAIRKVLSAEGQGPRDNLANGLLGGGGIVLAAVFGYVAYVLAPHDTPPEFWAGALGGLVMFTFYLLLGSLAKVIRAISRGLAGR